MPFQDSNTLGTKFGPGPRLPSRMRQMTDAEAAWVGAMIEAEGCVVVQGRNPRVDVTNTDPEVLSALLRATGAGSVLFRPQPNPAYKPAFYWFVGRQLEIRDLVRQCSRYSMKLQRLEA